MKKIVIGSDHAGYNLKEEIKKFLVNLGYQTIDVGCDSPESVDYPIYATKVAKKVSSGEFKRGIIICGTGAGMAMTANKTKGIRAVCCNDLYTAIYSRLHNDANILTMGARIIDVNYAKLIVLTWLNTNFEGGRHIRRIEQVMSLEK